MNIWRAQVHHPWVGEYLKNRGAGQGGGTCRISFIWFGFFQMKTEAVKTNLSSKNQNGTQSTPKWHLIGHLVLLCELSHQLACLSEAALTLMPPGRSLWASCLQGLLSTCSRSFAAPCPAFWPRQPLGQIQIGLYSPLRVVRLVQRGLDFLVAYLIAW